MTVDEMFLLLNKIDCRYREGVHSVSIKKKHLNTMNKLRSSTGVKEVVYDVGESDLEEIKKSYVDIIHIIESASEMDLVEIKNHCLYHHYELVQAAFTRSQNQVA